MKKTILSKCASIQEFIFNKVPNNQIPFKGDFPIVKDWQAEKWWKEFNSHMYLEDCSDWMKETVAKGMIVESISHMFRSYLRNAGVEDFDSLKNDEKADWLVRFLNKNCMTTNALLI